MKLNHMIRVSAFVGVLLLSQSTLADDKAQCGLQKVPSALDGVADINDILGTKIIGKYLPESENPSSTCLLLGKTDKDETITCSGTLIGKKQVLTAAHCIDDLVELGVICGGSGGIQPIPARVLTASRHPKYVAGKKDFDVSVIDLDRDIPIAPMEIAFKRKETESLIMGGGCRMSGWGTGNDGKAGVQHTVVMPSAVSLTEETAETPDEFYIGGENYNRDPKRAELDKNSKNGAREGDSGGSLYCKNEKGEWILIGVLARAGSYREDFEQNKGTLTAERKATYLDSVSYKKDLPLTIADLTSSPELSSWIRSQIR